MTEKTTEACPICQGSRTVRLFVYHPVTTKPLARQARLEDSSRTYPCPECTRKAVSEEHVTILQHTAVFGATYLVREGLEIYAMRTAAAALSRRLLDDQFIKFSYFPNVLPGSTEVVATLAAVAPSHVASMEQRIAERQGDVARRVVEQAVREIEIWGSAFGGTGGSIHKEMAVEAVKMALIRVLSTPRTHAT
ncbi:MAG TPA: hypothetical protein VNT30_09220 [Stellaceae bacterium]|nr:hypothetical protein [Stellaceae bacterium]